LPCLPWTEDAHRLVCCFLSFGASRCAGSGGRYHRSPPFPSLFSFVSVSFGPSLAGSPRPVALLGRVELHRRVEHVSAATWASPHRTRHEGARPSLPAWRILGQTANDARTPVMSRRHAGRLVGENGTRSETRSSGVLPPAPLSLASTCLLGGRNR